MKKLLYVTGSRAEYGIMKRLLHTISAAHDIELSIVATGMHCDKNYGLTYKIIEADGFIIDRLIDIKLNTEKNSNIINSMSICLNEFGNYLEKNKFDAILLLGDRYEIYAVAIAAAFHNIPIIHLHGGEQTLGNYDEFIRHSITKMAKLHLASTESYRQRIIQMGESPDTVFNIGSLGAENSLLLDLSTKKELESTYGSLEKPYFVVVFHPETLSLEHIDFQIQQLLSAIVKLSNKYDFIFIGSNSDTGSNNIREKIKNFSTINGYRYLESVKTEDYLSLNKYSCGLIGNSSSGLIEVPSLGIPTINIGDRQKGRVRGNSVIDCSCNEHDIINSIINSQSTEFKEKLKKSKNPYYKGNAMIDGFNIIKDYLKKNNNNPKEFFDISIVSNSSSL